MADDNLKQQVRGHIIAFAVVLVLAMVAGGTTIMGLASIEAVLAIAAVQAVVVVGFMMHLQRDGSIVGGTIAACGVLIVAMAGLMVLGLHDRIDGTEDIVVELVQSAESSATPEESEAEAH